jgi:hypothetical protein
MEEAEVREVPGRSGGKSGRGVLAAAVALLACALIGSVL